MPWSEVFDTFPENKLIFSVLTWGDLSQHILQYSNKIIVIFSLLTFLVLVCSFSFLIILFCASELLFFFHFIVKLHHYVINRSLWLLSRVVKKQNVES